MGKKWTVQDAIKRSRYVLDNKYMTNGIEKKIYLFPKSEQQRYIINWLNRQWKRWVKTVLKYLDELLEANNKGTFWENF